MNFRLMMPEDESDYEEHFEMLENTDVGCDCEFEAETEDMPLDTATETDEDVAVDEANSQAYAEADELSSVDIPAESDAADAE